uniref:Uncharacterized protein n=1 Tax=Siphoviridae sp. ctHip2 TaxID=2827830 RepID=A0A8S5RW69_9CAUD|nr:MAG TPA: hypothetical protein [Siphoviridae sp. ctHip2]
MQIEIIEIFCSMLFSFCKKIYKSKAYIKNGAIVIIAIFEQC